ncbi:RNA polymerase sigma-70 factor [Gabonibacter chumensis]|uniref:RNA polymerase sigma-70 factor n=1 Tax=Gabonibacter chumensis TaxID=2972474 RepID=UPI002573B6DA|nr:RNA polymerase sigma-70 factor [Gabonibacter chumensis]
MNHHYNISLKNGTRINFQTIFDQYFNSLVLFAERYLNNSEESKSVIQDAFMALWENRSILQDEMAIKAYLYSTARNKALNLLKHQKIADEYNRERLQKIDSEFYYMQSVIEEETQRMIFTAIDSLPEQCRKVCLLNLEGWNNLEISRQLNISLNTVKFHKKNAYKLLREKLQDYFYLLLLV